MLFVVWLGIPLSCIIFRNKNVQDSSKMVWSVILVVLLFLSILLGG